MSYSAEILADSIAPHGKRLTTLKVTFPRFILAEVNTHRMLSRNSASSRAIPPEKQIEAVRRNPFIPETFNERVIGMGIGEALADNDQELCRNIWLEARDHAVNAADALTTRDVDKSRVNRLLEPFLWHTAIITATEWDNFFALRLPPDGIPDSDFGAQIEFQMTAARMLEAMKDSEPVERTYAGDWHLPLVSESEKNAWPELYAANISAGRCARVSYEKQEEAEDTSKTWKRSKLLAKSGHWSPFEHQAYPIRLGKPSGNFYGWMQYRKEFPGEECYTREDDV